MSRQEIGDGDRCPQDQNHGRMWCMASKRQWCPSSRHSGGQFYEYDGVTPVPAPKPGVEAAPPAVPHRGSGTSTPASGAVGEGL